MLIALWALWIEHIGHQNFKIVSQDTYQNIKEEWWIFGHSALKVIFIKNWAFDISSYNFTGDTEGVTEITLSVFQWLKFYFSEMVCVSALQRGFDRFDDPCVYPLIFKSLVF